MTLLNPRSNLDTLNCWNEIGIAGDRSCPELTEMIHCRNCPVFARAAQGFFDRAAPDGYLKEWSDQLSNSFKPVNKETLSLLIFRLGHEWFGVRSQIVVEVTLPRPIHSIPHRRSAILEGMVNLRGQIQLQVSLKELFGVSHSANPSRDPKAGDTQAFGGARLIVLMQAGETWVFLADEVLEVRRFSKHEARTVPSTLSNSAFSFSQSVFVEESRTIGYLDEARLFEALREIQG